MEVSASALSLFRQNAPAVGELVFLALDEFESEFKVAVGRVVEVTAAADAAGSVADEARIAARIAAQMAPQTSRWTGVS
eukprot:2037859-Pleurochrysis_carterae.AAC.1